MPIPPLWRRISARAIPQRIRAGTRRAFLISAAFSLATSALVCVFAAPLMGVFRAARMRRP